jgi:hypothetical protein
MRRAERIPCWGHDPNVAEAVETRPVAEAEHHHMVVKELLRGYRLNGRVARAARVAIGEHSPEAGAVPDQEPLVGADEVPAAPGPPLSDPLAEAADEVAPEFESLPPPAEEAARLRRCAGRALGDPVVSKTGVKAFTRPPAARLTAPARPHGRGGIDLLRS